MTNLLSHFSLLLSQGASTAPGFLAPLLNAPLVPVAEMTNNTMSILSVIASSIWAMVMNFIYYVAHWVWNIVDIMQYLVYQMAGIGRAEDVVSLDNPLFNFLLNKKILLIFEAMFAIAIVLVIIFAIIALIKVRYDEATDSNKDSNRKIFGRVSKTLFLFVMGPAVLLGFIILTNSIISSLNQTLNVSGMSNTLGGQMFTAASYDANRYRQYADNNKRIPLLINFNDPIKDGSFKTMSNLELVEAYKKFTKGKIIYDDFATNNFKSFDDTLVYDKNTNSTYNAASTYSEFEKFVCTREQYYVMADFIDDSVQSSTHFFIKNASSSDIDWKYVNDAVYKDNVLTIKYKTHDNNEKIVTYGTGALEPSTPIEDAVTVISEILGLGSEKNANSFNMLQRLEGSLNIVDWTSESAVVYYKKTTTDEIEKYEFSQTEEGGYTKELCPVKQIQKRTYWPSLGETVVTGTYQGISLGEGMNMKYFAVEKLDKKVTIPENSYSYKLVLTDSLPSEIEIGKYDIVSDFIKKGTWPEKLLNDISVIFSDINIKDLIASGEWTKALSVITQGQQNNQSSNSNNSSTFGTSMINPLGIILAEMFLGSISYPKPNEAFGKLEFQPVYSQRTLRSIMLSIVGEERYFNLCDQLDYYNELFNNMMTPVLDTISNAEGFELSSADTESVRLYTYKAYLASLLLEKNFSKYMGDLAFNIVNLNFIFNKVKDYDGKTENVSNFINTLTTSDIKYVKDAIAYLNPISIEESRLPRNVQLFVKFFKQSPKFGDSGNNVKIDDDINNISEGRWRDIMNSDIIISDVDAISIANNESASLKRIDEIINEFKNKAGTKDDGYSVFYKFLTAIENGTKGTCYSNNNGDKFDMDIASKKWIYDHYINNSKENKDYIDKTHDNILLKYRDMLVEYYGLRNQLDMYYKHSVYSNLRSYISESMSSSFIVVVRNISYKVALNTSTTKFAEIVLGNTINGTDVINAINSGAYYQSLSYYGQKVIEMIQGNTSDPKDQAIKDNLTKYIAGGVALNNDKTTMDFVIKWFADNKFDLTYVGENYEGLVNEKGETFGLLREFLGKFGEYCFDVSLKSNFLNLTDNFPDVDFDNDEFKTILFEFIQLKFKDINNDDTNIKDPNYFVNKFEELGFVYNINYRLKDYKKQAMNMLVNFPVRLGESTEKYTTRYLFALNMACAEYSPHSVTKNDTVTSKADIVISDYSKGLILRLAGIPNRPESEIVGLEYNIDLSHDHKSSENEGAVYIMCSYNPESFLYEPILYSGNNKDKLCSESYYYDSNIIENKNEVKRSSNYYPIIAKGAFDMDGNPTAIREKDGKIEFYRDSIYIVNAGEFKLTSYYQTTDSLTVHYGIIGSIVNAGSRLFTGKTITAHLLEKIPRFAVNSSLTLPYGVKNSLVYSVNDGSVNLDYNFNAREAIAMKNLYSPGDLNVIILLFATAFIFIAIMKLVWAMIKRIFDITILFALSPVALSTGVLYGNDTLSDKNSRVGKWINTMTSRILSVYGVVISLNIFFILIPIINEVNLFDTNSFKAVTDIVLFRGASMNVINSLFRIIMMLAAVVMIGEAPKLISTIINIDYDDGTETLQEVTGAIRKVKYVVTGQALVDKAALLGDDVKSFIPGSALVKTAGDKIGKVKDYSKKKSLEKKALSTGVDPETARKASEELINAKNMRKNAKANRRDANVKRATENQQRNSF
ncbi:MAG: hypothetical protein RR334_02010 [Clostridia bacterium]